MKNLLIVNSSGRSARSITRTLADRFAAAWLEHHPDGQVITRDVGLHPVSPISECWIASAFTDPAERTPAMRNALASSDELIDELLRAAAVVVCAPMYNFGMPAQLKAYVDQIVRVGRTFSFGVSDSAQPYLPLVPSKPVVIITSTGAGGYEPGGPLSRLNFLEPHLEAIFNFIGLTDLSFVRVGFEERKDEQFEQAMTNAERAIHEIVVRLGGKMRACHQNKD